MAPLPIHLGLYAEWLADAHQALVRQRPGQVLVLDVEVPQLATHTAPAPGFQDPTGPVDRVIPGLGIGLQDAALVQ